MTNRATSPHDEAYERAREAFRQLSREQKLERLRDLGILGVTPHLGDKVRLQIPLGVWHYAIVVGADANGHVHAVHNDQGSRVVVARLDHLTEPGEVVELVQRARSGTEQAVAAAALKLQGTTTDIAGFDVENPSTNGVSLTSALGFLLAGAGLVVAAIALSGDASWDANVGRYRDGRGRFSRA